VIVMPLAAVERRAPRLPVDGDPQLARGMRRMRAIAAPRRRAAGEASRRQATAAGAR